MLSDPLSRVTEAFKTHVAECPDCRYEERDPWNTLCEIGKGLLRQKKSLERENPRPSVSEDPKVWNACLPEWRMQQITPKGWSLFKYAIAGDLLIVTLRHNPPIVLTKAFTIKISECTRTTDEARREWIESTLALEALYAVS